MQALMCRLKLGMTLEDFDKNTFETVVHMYYSTVIVLKHCFKYRDFNISVLLKCCLTEQLEWHSKF